MLTMKILQCMEEIVSSSSILAFNCIEYLAKSIVVETELVTKPRNKNLLHLSYKIHFYATFGRACVDVKCFRGARSILYRLHLDARFN